MNWKERYKKPSVISVRDIKSGMKIRILKPFSFKDDDGNLSGKNFEGHTSSIKELIGVVDHVDFNDGDGEGYDDDYIIFEDGSNHEILDSEFVEVLKN